MGVRRLVVAGATALLAAGLVLAYVALTRVPRPDLPYPTGHTLVSVRGNCATGYELFGCSTEDGPRSFLTVRAVGDPRAAAERLFAQLTQQGWSTQVEARTARDFSLGGAPEDLQPLYCKAGCVGLFRLERGGFVLAWFEE